MGLICRVIFILLEIERMNRKLHITFSLFVHKRIVISFYIYCPPPQGLASNEYDLDNPDETLSGSTPFFVFLD